MKTKKMLLSVGLTLTSLFVSSAAYAGGRGHGGIIKVFIRMPIEYQLLIGVVVVALAAFGLKDAWDEEKATSKEVE